MVAVINNLGLALGMSLKFYSNVANVVYTNMVRKFWRLIATFLEVTEKKSVGGNLFDRAKPRPVCCL